MKTIRPRDADYQPPESLGGQMTDLERQKLFDWVYESEPSVAVEIGGGSGGGSTFSIIEAMARLRDEGKCQDSILITADPQNESAREFYGKHERYKGLVKFLRFSSDFEHIFLSDEANIPWSFPPPDFLFFDGPEDADLSLKDFKFFDNIVKSGCKFSCHDWETSARAFDGVASIKASTLRPYIENLDTWEQVECLSGLFAEWPNVDVNIRARSVGLCYYRKI
jgi:hypothetical protein|tara:strand:- start:528 stop:1196 length:669 start_codon:yes stop_codon:yes gene_type:complete